MKIGNTGDPEYGGSRAVAAESGIGLAAVEATAAGARVMAALAVPEAAS